MLHAALHVLAIRRLRAEVFEPVRMALRCGGLGEAELVQRLLERLGLEIDEEPLGLACAENHGHLAACAGGMHGDPIPNLG